MNSVCFFGVYDPNYARSRVLMSGFRELGWEVVECRINPREHTRLGKYLALCKEYRRVRNEHFTLVIVGFPGQSVILLARVLFRKPIIFDAFISLYDSYVFDRKFFSSRNPRAWKSWLMDYMGVRLATYVLLDTNQHIEYFIKTFYAPREKFIRVFIGADEKIMHPKDAFPSHEFVVEFHGSFIPLQGIGYILEAAALMKKEPITFQIIGDGQEYLSMRKKAKELGLQRVVFTGRVPSKEVADYIAKAQVCLGIFGDTNKTQRVIPNKVYECMAMGKPIITADTPAIRELGSPENLPLRLVPAADPEAIAEAILLLAQDGKASAALGKEAHDFFKRHLHASTLVEHLLGSLPASALRPHASPL